MPAPLFDEPFLRKLERLTLLSRRAAAGQMQGERRSSKRGQSVEFADFRPYSSGDDFRRIDWNAYARLERFFIKLFVEEQDLTVHLLVDASRSMNWGEPNKFEFAARTAGALGYITLLSLDRVSVKMLANGSTPSVNHLSSLRGKQQALALFTFLHKYILENQRSSDRPAAGRNVAPPARSVVASELQAYAGTARQPGPLVLMSDLLDDGWMPGVNSLASRGFEVTILHILSPDEINPTLNGDFRLVDTENGASVEITADFETLERYRRSLSDWQDSWRNFSAGRGVRYVPVETSASLEDLLFAWLRQAGVLR
jgi:uncharacterized protein (DUF58 family)